MSEFSVEVDDSRIRARLSGMSEKLHSALVRKTTVLRLLLEAKVEQKLSGDVLNVRTGNLRRSIFSDQADTATSVEGRVASSGDVKYGRIHEYGGTVHIPEIVPVKAKALHFATPGGDVFAMRTKAHDVTIPQRSFMRSSLADMREEIVSGYKEAALKEAGL